MLNFCLTIVTSTIHNECDKYCPILYSSLQHFRSLKEAIEVSEVTNGQTSALSYVEGLCCGMEFSLSSLPTPNIPCF